MPIGRELMEVIANSSQDECREMGEMMIALSKSPRDKVWRHKMAEALRQFPEPPRGNLADRFAAAEERYAAMQAQQG